MIPVPDTIATHQDMLTLQKACIERVEFYVDLAQTKLGKSIPIPKIRFDIKGTTAGYAHYRENMIRFNPTIIRLNPHEFLERTPGHEVAHLIAHQVNKQCEPHGNDWRNVMWAFGLPAIRCHNYDTNPMEAPRKKPTIIHREDEGITIRPTNIGRVITFD